MEPKKPHPCPKCQTPMTLDKRKRPESGAMFVGEDYWICPNPKCGHTEVAD